MPSILDQLSINNADAQNNLKQDALLETDDEKSSFKWSIVYTKYLNEDDSRFEKRVISLLAPFGDVVIRDFADKSQDKDADEAFNKLYQKKIILFNKPRFFRTDARIMIHLLLNAAHTNHTFVTTMYVNSNKLGMMVKYASIAPVDLAGFRTLYQTYPFPTGDLVYKVNEFCDGSLKPESKEEAISVISSELNRIRQHYLNIAVV